MRFLTAIALAATFGSAVSSPALAQESLPQPVGDFLRAHCVKCHGALKQSGGIRLDELDGAVGRSIHIWFAIREQLADGLMPPTGEPAPKESQVRELLAWITAQTSSRAAPLPNQGNLIPHNLLFGKPAPTGAAAEGRLWRLSPDGYLGFVRSVGRSNSPGIVQPFTLTPERGIKDFSGLYSIDEPSTEILLRNAELIVESLCAHEIKDGQVRGKNNATREFVELMDPKATPTTAQLENGVQRMFQTALGRAAAKDEVARFLKLYEKCATLGDRPAAVKTMLQAVLLRTDAMFRSELGEGKEKGHGRRMLAPHELATAISLTLGDRRDSTLLAAAQKGELATPEQVARHVHRILNEPKADTARILRFFQEYFEYGKAVDIFKEKPKGFMHVPRTLVNDTDQLILHVVQADRDVLRQLLITDRTFANFTIDRNKKDGPKPAVVPNPINNKGQKAPHFVYGFEDWPTTQPAVVPEGKRLGILMQPSWLVAHATNFDNDPVRRGRWIRERLLGGNVPDLPIGVAAQVPDDKHRTFRDRLQVTRDARCWKCHRMMDDLGLPFEQFDHYGLHRTAEMVLDPEETEKNVDKKGKSLGEVLRAEKLDTTGKIANSDDSTLDGAIKNPHELVRRLADSERVRQVFVRHAFRYFLGRNETLSDAKTLQDADHAYLASGGSFKALVVALLASDSYLYRSTAIAAKNGDSR